MPGDTAARQLQARSTKADSAADGPQYPGNPTAAVVRGGVRGLGRHAFGVSVTVLVAMALGGCGDEGTYDGRVLPTEAITRCGKPPPAPSPIDDPKQLAQNDNWNDCAFPKRSTKSVEDLKQDAWNDYVDEIRQQATEDCLADRQRTCTDLEVDAWVQEYLDRQAELDHEMDPESN